jgi:hypothetical protein
MAKVGGKEKVSEEGAKQLIEEPMRIAAQLLRPLGPDIASTSIAQLNDILNAKSSQDKLREAVDIVYNSSYNTLTSLLKMGKELAELDNNQRTQLFDKTLPKVLLANIDMAVDIARLNERYGLKMTDLLETTLKANREERNSTKRKRKCPEETVGKTPPKTPPKATRKKS